MQKLLHYVFMKIKKVFYLLICIFFLASCSTSKQSTQKRENKRVETKNTKNKASKEAKKVLNYAYKLTGTSYRYGGNTSRGFDCSGFVQYVYKNFNYSLPRTTKEQSRVGKSVSKKNLRPGDLVFFTGRNAKSSDVGHVGIVVESYTNGSFKFIHVSSSRGVTDDFSDASYWNPRYLKGRRILRN